VTGRPTNRAPAPAPVSAPPGGLREQRRARTRRSIQEHALRLFLAKGYESTTVAEIAAAAGVSHMTFFRYFPTKEAVVEGDEYDPLLVELIRNRPDDEPPLTALREAIREGLGMVYAADRDALLTRTRLILQTPALRARMVHNLTATAQMFAQVLAGRYDTGTGTATAIGTSTDTTLQTRVVAAAALAALTTAITAWADNDGTDELPDLIDKAFDVLHHLAE
jgi:AcrR family transcriptional regulator